MKIVDADADSDPPVEQDYEGHVVRHGREGCLEVEQEQNTN